MPSLSNEPTIQMTYKVTAFIRKDEEGKFFGLCPALKGVNAIGDTLEESLENLKEAVAAYIVYLIRNQKPIPLTAEAVCG